ncbi:ATP-grasp domain-containing protein [Kitasatospora sp. NPDC101183]|uniref:ATP-grasp domain-containing protein n=1 Tax=Kitasatospora sp. NPDC101183 TaxID=3364100 RepID=UPI0037FE8742
MPSPAILFPADPLNPRRPDPHFAWEARLLRDLGGVHHLVDHDALLTGDADDARGAVRRVPEGVGPLWYRGWMLPSARYAGFAGALAARGGNLLTSPAGYAAAHELPGWYGVFEGATPPSAWIPSGNDGDGAAAPGPRELEAAVARLGGSGPAIVKDYVKSRKHEWHEACYVPELADLAAVGRVVGRFVELQGEFLAGGVVLRRFEEFDRAAVNGGEVEKRAVEARVWWLDGRPILVGPHPDAPHQVVEPQLAGVSSLVRTLGCRFVTTDLARLADGSGWRVVEVGDGQVSDLPRGIDASGLLTSLIAA